MNSTRWFLTAVTVIVLSSLSAMYFASSLAKQVKAQSSPPPPTMDLPKEAPGFEQNIETSAVPQPSLDPAADSTSQMDGQGELSDDSENGDSLANEVTDDGGRIASDLKTQNPDGYVYDPSGRRDPFFPSASVFVQKPSDSSPVLTESPDESPQSDELPVVNSDPLLAYYVKDYRLVGVLWDVSRPRAMLRSPNGAVYTVQLKTKLGREGGVIAAIREKEVVVAYPDTVGKYSNKSETASLRMQR